MYRKRVQAQQPHLVKFQQPGSEKHLKLMSEFQLMTLVMQAYLSRAHLLLLLQVQPVEFVGFNGRLVITKLVGIMLVVIRAYLV